MLAVARFGVARSVASPAANGVPQPVEPPAGDAARAAEPDFVAAGDDTVGSHGGPRDAIGRDHGAQSVAGEHLLALAQPGAAADVPHSPDVVLDGGPGSGAKKGLCRR